MWEFPDGSTHAIVRKTAKSAEERRREEVMGYKSVEQQQAAVEAAKYENAKKQARLDVYRKYANSVKGGVILVCEANDKRISDIIDRYIDRNPDILHTLDLFDAAIATNPTEYNSLAKNSEVAVREQLVDQIIDMLAAHGKGHNDFTLRSEQTRLRTFSIPQLRQRLADLQTKHNMAGQSVQQLKSLVADSRPAASSDGYPELPSHIWDGTKHVRVDAEYLNGLIKTDLWQFKRLVKLYGSAKIDRARGVK
jgi:hypothetical protein